MRIHTAAALLALSFGSQALGGVTYGNVEWRWRERGLGVLPIVGGQQITSLDPGAAASSPNAINDPSNAFDARFHLVLEGRVVRTGGNTDLRGLGAIAGAAISTDNRAQGSFAGYLGDFDGEMWNNALASTAVATASPPSGSGLTLPSGATQLPGATGPGDRGIFGPFRAYMDSNQRAGGIQNYSSLTQGDLALANLATMEQLVILTGKGPFLETDPDTGDPGPYNGRYDFMALDTWVPVAAFTYNLMDVTSLRSIVISFDVEPSSDPDDPNIRGYRGLPNSLAGGLDLWPIANTGIPDFVIAVPAPGAGALLGVGLLMTARRRR